MNFSQQFWTQKKISTVFKVTTIFDVTFTSFIFFIYNIIKKTKHKKCSTLENIVFLNFFRMNFNYSGNFAKVIIQCLGFAHFCPTAQYFTTWYIIWNTFMLWVVLFNYSQSRMTDFSKRAWYNPFPTIFILWNA